LRDIETEVKKIQTQPYEQTARDQERTPQPLAASTANKTYSKPTAGKSGNERGAGEHMPKPGWRFWTRWSSLEKTQALFNLFLVVFTAGLWWSSCQQWSVARTEVEEAHKAFVFASAFEIRPHATPEQAVDPNDRAAAEITVSVYNSGDTPARSLFIHSSANLSRSPAPDYPDILMPNTPSQEPLFLAPRQTTEMPLVTNEFDMMAVREGRTPLTVYGHIEYTDDVLHKQHRTWFCAVYKTHLSLKVGHVTGIDTFARCPEHNCADDDCPEPWDYQPPTAQGPSKGTISVQAP
jgi:hypothetical protein